MTADQVGPLQGHVDSHTVTVVVRCGFIGCDWSMEIGTAPLEVHNAYLDHLDVHDVDAAPVDDCDQEDGEEVKRTDEAIDELGAVCGLYANDTPEQTVAEQASFDRFMAGGEDQ